LQILTANKNRVGKQIRVGIFCALNHSIFQLTEDAINNRRRDARCHRLGRPERWVDEHGDCLYRYALLRVRRLEIAEDLVQETFFTAVRTSGCFRGKSSERSWLCGILKNKICDHFRTLGRETSFTDLEFLDDELSNKFVSQGFWNHERGPLEWKPEAEVVYAHSVAILRAAPWLVSLVRAIFFSLRKFLLLWTRSVCLRAIQRASLTIP
jgi:Sigma-70 region 2